MASSTRRLFLILFCLLCACTPSAPPDRVRDPLPPGDGVRGQALFEGRATLADGYPPGCGGCHTLVPNERLYCPSLYGVASRAPSRLRDAAYHGRASTTEQYLRESILTPSAYIVPDLPVYGNPRASEMPPGFAARLSDQDLADIVAFLLTLR